MRLVLDTNILISACWSPGGLEAALVRLGVERHVTLCVTEVLREEYREVSERPKFATRRACFAELFESIAGSAELVDAGPAVDEASDPDDNRLLECALAAQADWLITGNLRDFPTAWPEPWRGIRIVNARQFFNANPGWAAKASVSPGP